MSGWWLSGLLVVILTVPVVNSKVDLDSPVRMAQCRATCLHKMVVNKVSDYHCRRMEICSQCWEMCELLENNQSPCGQQDCGRSCLEACRFYSLSPNQPHARLTQYEETLIFDGRKISWPSPDSQKDCVFIVMGQEVGKPWSQLFQTLDMTAKIRPEVDLESVRVMVVDYQGLAMVLSPQPESPLLQIQTIIHSLGLDNRIKISHTTCGFSQENRTAVLRPALTQERGLWRLRELSMTHHASLVLAQISWDPQILNAESQLIYLVTWEVDGGIVRGNLLTNSSCVTLSLAPDTVYTIQVSLLDPHYAGSQSEPLILDTHHVHKEPPGAALGHTDTSRQPVIQRQSEADRTSRQTQLVAVVAAGVSVFLLVILTVTWKWHQQLSLPHSKLIDKETGIPNLYRVFPPVIRLVTEPYVMPDIFASTDNLLEAANIEN